MTALRRLVALGALVLTMTFPAAVGAQAKGGRKDSKSPEKTEPTKVLKVEEELKVEGRIQKPQAMFLMPRASLDVRDLERSEPFLPRVVEALGKEPF